MVPEKLYRNTLNITLKIQNYEITQMTYLTFPLAI